MNDSHAHTVGILQQTISKNAHIHTTCQQRCTIKRIHIQFTNNHSVIINAHTYSVLINAHTYSVLINAHTYSVLIKHTHIQYATTGSIERKGRALPTHQQQENSAGGGYAKYSDGDRTHVGGMVLRKALKPSHGINT